MPALVSVDSSDRKRKRADHAFSVASTKPRKAMRMDGGNNVKTRIVELEDAILRGQGIQAALDELFSVITDTEQRSKTAVLAAVTACRAFTRLITSEKLTVASKRSAKDVDEAHSLQASLQQFTKSLYAWIGDEDATKEDAAITLLMRIVKEEVHLETKQVEQAWRSSTSTFVGLLRTLLQKPNAEGARQLFAEKYLEEHDDVRYFSLSVLPTIRKEEDTNAEVFAACALDLLVQVEGIPDTQDQLEDWYGRAPEGQKSTLLSLSAHRKVAQHAWLSVFSSPLTHEQRKKILHIMNAQVLPWFATRLEVLTDFLTDSFNASGPTAVLALGGLFHLMTQRNIDYPDFYRKLYSLLDESILHSKHRGNFLRLLETCMASSHLPAVLLASFMKRLARLALQAPPGAIVWIVPWIYNQLRQHPACTYMLHRQEHPSHAIYASYPISTESGMRDPFNMDGPDPMLTQAIDSSLWELHTLQSHYHPNVATLASILSEQFTKREYQTEDFLDHTYATLLDSELSRDLKKEPVVEWEIPKHIVTADKSSADNLNQLGFALQAAIDVM